MREVADAWILAHWASSCLTRLGLVGSVERSLSRWYERSHYERSQVKATARKIDPREFVLAVLSPKKRFEAGKRAAREAFQNTTLTIEDIEAAVRRVRRKFYAARQEKTARRR
jgi:hypothetical protein